MGLFSKKKLTKSEIKIKLTEINEQIAKQKVNHILHLLLSVFTAGVWLIVWILISISSSIEIKRLKKKREELLIQEGWLEKSSEAKNSSSTAIDDLSKLADMHEKGLLTDEEFTQQKEKLLKS